MRYGLPVIIGVTLGAITGVYVAERQRTADTIPAKLLEVDQQDAHRRFCESYFRWQDQSGDTVDSMDRMCKTVDRPPIQKHPVCPDTDNACT